MTVVVLAVVSIVAAIIAVGNARRAERRAREALGRQLGLAALDVPAGELDQALLLSLAAADLQGDDDASRFQASRALIGRYSRLEALLHPAEGANVGVSFRGVAIDPAGDRIVATAWSPDGSAQLLSWEGGTRTQPTAVAVPDGYSPSVAFAGDTGRIVIGTTGGTVGVMGEGGAVIPVGDQVVALDLAGGRALVLADDGALDLVDVDSATSIVGPISGPIPGSDAGPPADGPLFDLSGGRVVVASAGRVVLLDASDGEELASVDDATPLVAVAVGPTDGRGGARRVR